jgi:hypothetical protein
MGILRARDQIDLGKASQEAPELGVKGQGGGAEGEAEEQDQGHATGGSVR